MTPQPLPFEPDSEARAARRIAVAHRLVEMGLEMAEAVQRRALAQLERDIAAAEADDAPAEDAAAEGRRDDPVAAVERVARTVRLSLALAARLDSDEPVRRARVRDGAKAEREAEKAAQLRTLFEGPVGTPSRGATRAEIVVEVTAQALDQAGLDEDEVLERIDEIEERLYEGEWEIDVCARPIGAMVAKLCAGMDVTPDWSAWVNEPWAIKEAETNAEGSPYAVGGAAWVRAGGDSAPDKPPEQPVSALVAADGSSP